MGRVAPARYSLSRPIQGSSRAHSHSQGRLVRGTPGPGDSKGGEAGRCGFPATSIGAGPDAERPFAPEDTGMFTSYGVVWREGDSPLARGKLELLPSSVKLDGVADSRPVIREVPYENLAVVRVGRSSSDRLDGHPSLLLERRSGQSIAIASVAQAGVVAELAEKLAALRLGSAGGARMTGVVLPLKEGAREAASSLLEAGPPFDPERIGLEHHEVFLTESEVVFLFTSQLGVEALEPLLADPEFWQDASAWGEHIAGPPRLAESVYSWTKPEAAENVSFLSTPGPGDSDGGDIFDR